MLSSALMILALSMGAALAPGVAGSTARLRPVGHRSLAFAPALSLGLQPSALQHHSAWAPGLRSTIAVPPGRRAQRAFAAFPAGAARMQQNRADIPRSAAPRPSSGLLPRAGRIGSQGAISGRVGRAVSLDMASSEGEKGVSGFFAKLCRSAPLYHSGFLTSFRRPWSLGNLNLVDFFPAGLQAF